MKKVLSILLFAAMSAIAFNQVVPATVASGSNSGDGEIKAAITALNLADQVLQTATALKSNTASPTFTGVVDAPTLEVDSISFDNGAEISNLTSDSLIITETAVAIHGNLQVSGDITTDGSFPSDFAITDEQLPFDEYWAKTIELNKLPAMEYRNRHNMSEYIAGVEEANERLLRYVVDMEVRLKTLEGKLNE